MKANNYEQAERLKLEIKQEQSLLKKLNSKYEIESKNGKFNVLIKEQKKTYKTVKNNYNTRLREFEKYRNSKINDLIALHKRQLKELESHKSEIPADVKTRPQLQTFDTQKKMLLKMENFKDIKKIKSLKKEYIKSENKKIEEIRNKKYIDIKNKLILSQKKEMNKLKRDLEKEYNELVSIYNKDIHLVNNKLVTEKVSSSTMAKNIVNLSSTNLQNKYVDKNYSAYLDFNNQLHKTQTFANNKYLSTESNSKIDKNEYCMDNNIYKINPKKKTKTLKTFLQIIKK